MIDLLLVFGCGEEVSGTIAVEGAEYTQPLDDVSPLLEADFDQVQLSAPWSRRSFL